MSTRLLRTLVPGLLVLWVVVGALAASIVVKAAVSGDPSRTLTARVEAISLAFTRQISAAIGDSLDIDTSSQPVWARPGARLNEDAFKQMTDFEVADYLMTKPRETGGVFLVDSEVYAVANRLRAAFATHDATMKRAFNELMDTRDRKRAANDAKERKLRQEMDDARDTFQIIMGTFFTVFGVFIGWLVARTTTD